MADSERREIQEVNYRFSELEEMGSVNDDGSRELNYEQGESSSTSPSYHLDKFTLYETNTNFYMIGRDIRRRHWRVLKIGRSKPSEFVIHEDPTTYSYEECKDLLCSINEGNISAGGLKFVTHYHGIVGFIKLLESYYILLITERTEIGKICGHPIYSISKYKMISVSHSTALTYLYNSTKENRYKKLLQLVDIRDNFFFSCSYPLMHRVEQNLGKQDTGRSSDGTMFVWNEYLTHPIRDSLNNTLWTVALIHGFFKQVQLSTCGTNFVLTLIARRSCQFAGTRYEKRGVNEDGQAANDVEVEQIVWQVIDGECPTEITSIVQNRASIPLCWSQKPSLLNLKPDILLSECNGCYKASRLHFQNIRLRYGKPIIVLNLIKTSKKKHREFILHEEFVKAIASINEDLPEKDQVELWNLDLDAVFKNEDTDEMKELQSLAEKALNKTGIFSCQMPQSINVEGLPYTWVNSSNGNCKHQKGILRTNCLDSLDRTNVAQYVYGLVALGHQLHTLGIIEFQELDCQETKGPLVNELMDMYQAMGDALSLQYGGSPAHHKIFSKIKGQYKVATQFQEFMKSIQRHCSNSFTDGTKQQAIDLFLGHLQPEAAEVGGLATFKSKLDEREKCEWLNSIYFKNLFRCNLCIYSGFERLWFDSDAEESGPRYLTGPSGSPQHESQEGFPMKDFSASP